MAASPETVRLAAGNLRAEVSPGLGGRLARFWVERDGVVFDFLAPLAFDGSGPGGAGQGGCYGLAPYSNRIAEAAFVWEGRRVRLRPHRLAAPHSLHGFAWERRFDIISATRERLSLAHHHQGDDDWPWPLKVRLDFALSELGLEMTISAVNLANQAQPLGLGFHPFFPQRRTARLRFEAKEMWEGPADSLPRRRLPVPPDLDFASGRTPPEGLDHAFADIAAEADIIWPGAGWGLGLTASPDLRGAVLFSPRGRDLFCWEPVSHPIDAVNLPGQPGLVRLVPNAVQSAGLGLWPRSLL